MSERLCVSLKEVIGGGYDAFWHSQKRYNVVKGGKGSKKSCTTAVRLISRMMQPQYNLANALIVRKVMDTHRSSTFSQLLWAIEKLHAGRWWKATKSPLELTYMPTGQKILFRGMDDVLKLASLTVPRGYLCWVWIEEGFEIEKEDDFDKLDLSVPRGAVPAPLFKQTTITFNPWSERHWLKARFFDHPRGDAFVDTTNYLCNEFLDQTDRDIYEQMKRDHPRKYAVAGLGEWGVAEGLVFDRWTVEGFAIKEVVEKDPWQWRHVFGLDYGYTNDPTAFIAAAVNPVQKVIYIYDEHYEKRMLNSDIASMLIRKGYSKERIRADCAEPKSNEDLRRLGISRVHPASKGRDSIINGISRLQEYRIIIHSSCKNTAAEMSTYRWETDRAGTVLNVPVDSDNHLMDALRYAMEDVVHFRPGAEPEKAKRPSGTGVTANDMRGGWA